MTVEEKLATMNMVNMYRTYDSTTGKFVEWKPNTPDFVKQAYQHLMVDVGDNNNEGVITNGESNDVSAQPRGFSGQSTNLSERNQTAGERENDRETTSGLRRSGGEESGEVRFQSNVSGDVGERSVESGNQKRDTGIEQRLDLHPEPLIKGAEISTPPKDIILTSNTDIGYNLGAATKFDANLEAIRTLKKIEGEDRKATPAEQAILARYSGFGDSAFNDAFPNDPNNRYNREHESGMERRGEILRELVTPEEYQAIETSRINAFFTTPEIINAMWTALEKMGVNKLSHPHIIEPSAGSGRFFGYQPVELAARSERTAVEKDKLTGRMLRQLYPQTAVYVMGYEETPIPAETMDLAISNVPFGNISIFDPSFKGDRARFKKSIHNYFFGKTLQQLRVGGVLAFITTHNTLDAPTAQPVRELMAEDADFLGALRLPAGAFPDTAVVTDIIFMKKRAPNAPKGDTSWVESVPMQVKKKSNYSYGVYDVDVHVNKYFVDHPQMVCGKHSGSGTQYGSDTYSVEKLEGTNLKDLMANAINQLPADAIQDLPPLSKSVTAIPSGFGINEGARVIKNGIVYINHHQNLEKVNLSDEEKNRVKSMLAIRDAAKAVVTAELKNCGDNELLEVQEKLNKLYDTYVAQYGAMNNGKNRSLLAGDPDLPFLRALERDDKDHPVQDIAKLPKLPSDKASDYKMPIFSRRTINGYRTREVKTEADAIAVSMNEKGRLDLDYMANLLGTSKDQVIASLSAKGKIFKNPIGDWESADVYLTGEVREKLGIAAATASAKPEYKANVEALKAVQPKDLPPSQINAQLGAHWIPAKDVNDFVKFLLHPYGYYRRGSNNDTDKWFDYVPQTGEWVKEYDGKMDANSSTLSSEWGTHRMGADNLILRILNGSTIEVMDKDEDDKPVRNPEETVAAQEKAALIKNKFKEWVWQDAERAERLVTNYNKIFNGTRPRIFDGAHQEFPGMALKWKRQMHKHQKDAIWRVVQDRTAMLAHEVGFGKTAVMCAGAMELKRLGIAGKPLFVVPKSTHKQFYDQFKDEYPYASVLFPEEDDFSVGNRQEFISRIITGNWDAVILSNEQFKAIPLRPETEIGFIKQEIQDIKEALIGVEPEEKEDNSYSYRRHKEKESASHKELQKSLERALTRLKNAMEKVHEHSDKTVFFDDLGVDQLFVDEADNFKNLHFTTNMGRLKGLPNTDSTRAFDMYMKVRSLQQKGKNVGVLFATGTPVANTIAEMYTMMRYLQQPMLEAKGLKHFDAWAHTFGETVESLEQTPTGQYKMAQRFAKFNNAPELSKLWQDVTDIRVADEVPQMIALRPRIVDDHDKPRRTVISAPPTKDLLLYMEDLAKRAAELGQVDPREDNMFKITNDARLASLDMRMVDPRAKPNPQGKIALAARKIAEIYNKETADKGTQLVFLDLGTPKASEKVETVTTVDGGDVVPDENEETEEELKVLRNCYAVLKDYLVAAGIPEKEVRFIHDAKSNAQRKVMMEKVNAGDVRVIIGSTGKLGTGVNMQERACALHHLDAPWRPRDIEQREGRVIRQGNKVYGAVIDEETGEVVSPGKGVHIYSYVTERSFDGYMWQAIEAKSKAIKSIMRRDNPPREIEDIDSFTMSAGEAKAIATGNPDVMKEASLKNSINRLLMLQASHTDNIVRAHNQMSTLPKEIESYKSDIIKMADDATLAANNKSNVFKMAVNGKEYTEDTIAAGEALKVALTSSPTVIDYKQIPIIGSYKGFDILAHNQGSELGYRLIVRNPKTMIDYATLAIPYAELNAKGLVARINNKIDGIPSALEIRRGLLDQSEKNLSNYKKQSEAPFEYAPRLANMQKELGEVQDRLKSGKISPTTTENIDTSLPEELNEEEPLAEEQPTYQFRTKDEGELPPPRELTTNPTAEAQSVKNEVEVVEKTLEIKPPEVNAEATANKMGIPEQKLPATIEKETVKAVESVKDAPAIDVREVENSAADDEEAAAEIIEKYDKIQFNRTDLKEGTFYIPYRDAGGKLKYVPIHGFKVVMPGFEKYNFFISHPVIDGAEKNKGWRICETQTGLAIGDTYSSKSSAINDVQTLLERQGEANLDKGIKSGLEKQGKLPKSTEAVDTSVDVAHGKVEPPIVAEIKKDIPTEPTEEAAVKQEEESPVIKAAYQANREEEGRLAAQGGTGRMILLPKKLEAAFPKLYTNENVPQADQVVIAKFFHPLAGNMTWYATEYDPNEQIFFGYVDTGDYNSEWGYFSLKELQDTVKDGLHMERDLYFKPQKISEVSELQDRFGKSHTEPEVKGTFQQDVDIDDLVAEKKARESVSAIPVKEEITTPEISQVASKVPVTPPSVSVVPPVGQPLRNKLEEFRDEYRKELRKRVDTDSAYNWTDKSEQLAAEMPKQKIAKPARLIINKNAKLPISKKKSIDDDVWGIDSPRRVKPITSPTPSISGRHLRLDDGHGAHISQHMPRLPKH